MAATMVEVPLAAAAVVVMEEVEREAVLLAEVRWGNTGGGEGAVAVAEVALVGVAWGVGGKAMAARVEVETVVALPAAAGAVGTVA